MSTTNDTHQNLLSWLFSVFYEIISPDFVLFGMSPDDFRKKLCDFVSLLDEPLSYSLLLSKGWSFDGVDNHFSDISKNITSYSRYSVRTTDAVYTVCCDPKLQFWFTGGHLIKTYGDLLMDISLEGKNDVELSKFIQNQFAIFRFE